MIDPAKIPDGYVARREIPEPPADAVRWDGGEHPYPHGGYVLDHAGMRWRYDLDGLKAFFVYKDPRPVDGFSWRSWWFRQ